MSDVFSLDYTEAQGRRPFYDYPALEVSRTHNLANLRDCIAWMATCGEIDYRQESIPYVERALEEADLSADAIEQYSPMVKAWTPECAVTEEKYLAESHFLALPVLDSSEGQTSTAEIPFGVIGGLLRGQEVFTHISTGDTLGQRISIGRYVTRAYLQAFKEKLAPVRIRNYSTLSDLNAGVAEAVIAHLQQPANQEPNKPPIILKKALLQPRLVVTGSGDQKLLHGILERQPNSTLDRCVASTTYMAGFDRRPTMHVEQEVRSKVTSAVNLVAINHEQLSYGAVNEIGWLVLGSIVHNQALGIYMERHDSNDTSAANRQRQLTMSHISRLLQDFPWLTQRIKVARNTRELADWGAYKLDEHQDWRDAMGV